MKKNQSRRQFINLSLKAGITIPILGSSLISCTPTAKDKSADGNTPNKKLNILILGGTSFLGPHQIAYAMERGHSITTFTRGKTLPTIHQDLFQNVEQLIGDRASDLTALHDRKWDAVIDNSGHNADWTRETAKLLKDNVGLYIFTSSTGVYYPYLGSDIKEDTKLLMEEPEGIEDEELKLEYWYGVMKTNSELEAKKHFGEDRTIVVRPTYMIGPADKSDRFIYWPVRLPKGGEIMVPGKSEDPVQFIDVRDVGEWMIRLIENKNIGTYNAVGPKDSMGMHEFIKEAHSAFDSEAEFVMIDDYEFLLDHKVGYIVPWVMPVDNNKGSSLVNNQLALANGLTITPIKKSMIDIHNWWYSDAITEEHRQAFESTPDSIIMREKSIIQDWKEYNL